VGSEGTLDGRADRLAGALFGGGGATNVVEGPEGEAEATEQMSIKNSPSRSQLRVRRSIAIGKAQQT
jgi:hypothetical protein